MPRGSLAARAEVRAPLWRRECRNRRRWGLGVLVWGMLSAEGIVPDDELVLAVLEEGHRLRYLSGRRRVRVDARWVSTFSSPAEESDEAPDVVAQVAPRPRDHGFRRAVARVHVRVRLVHRLVLARGTDDHLDL